MQQYIWAFWGGEGKASNTRGVKGDFWFFVCVLFWVFIFFRPYQEMLERKKLEKKAKEIRIMYFCLRIGSHVIARVMKKYYHCTFIYQNSF